MFLARLSICLLFIGIFLGQAPVVRATPLIALREAQNCAGCHNPGRSQKPFFERRCTLDCQGCHVDPAGGGARNQWGYYYSVDQLPIYSPYKPIDPLKDESRFDLHVDTRWMQWVKPGGESVSFPMVSESTVRLRPFVKYLHLSYTALLLGRVDDHVLRLTDEGTRRYRERYALMVDNLPLNTYFRAYRGTPMYGIKRPNHSLWIRERLDLDQFATTDAIEMGATPNVPFFRVSRMSGDPYLDASIRQKGMSYHGGLRGVSYGWHLNTSGWATQSDFHKIRMQAVGAGATFYDFTFYGEQNWRQVQSIGLRSPTIPVAVQPDSKVEEYTVAYHGIRGVSAGVIQEKLAARGDFAHRTNLFIDLHPIPWLQFEIWRRRTLTDKNVEDTLGIVHLYADF